MMDIKTKGVVEGIIANLVLVRVNGPVAQNEIAYIHIGEVELMSEVIKVVGKNVYVQVYESTRGLKVGAEVEFQGHSLEVVLGPGMLSKNYDGLQNDLDKMTEIGMAMKKAALCGLGQTAANPVLSTMRYFKDEYIQHVQDKKCVAGKCVNLVKYEIDPTKCIGCTLCSKKCPANAITGEKKSPHKIDQAKCVKCGECFRGCKFGAISKC